MDPDRRVLAVMVAMSGLLLCIVGTEIRGLRADGLHQDMRAMTRRVFGVDEGH